MRKILLLVAVILALIVSITPLIACQFSEKDVFILSSDNFYSNWMQCLDGDTKLKNVVIPGAHDAATANIERYQNLIDNPLVQIFIAKTKCQSASIYDLLTSGVRYFDVRVKRSSEDGLLYTYHSNALFQPWIEVVGEIKAYLNSGKDFFILDFQHFENDAENEALELFMAEVDFERYALKTDTDINTLTMQDIIDSGKRFVVIWSRDTSIQSQYLFKRRQWLYSPYDQEKHYSPETLINHLDDYYERFDGDGLFVLQSQCSTNVATNPRELEDEMEPLANSYIQNITTKQLEKTNIVMRDFVDEGDKIPIILSLNLQKNIVKHEYVNFFNYE